MSCGKGIPVFGVALTVIGLLYCVAQWHVAQSLRGYWRMASLLPLPVLATVVGGASAIDAPFLLDTLGILLVGLPLSLVYLTALSTLQLAIRFAALEYAAAKKSRTQRRRKRAVGSPQATSKHS